MNDTATERAPLRLDPTLRKRVYDIIAETIGNTPLVRARRLAAEEGLAAESVSDHGIWAHLAVLSVVFVGVSSGRPGRRRRP